MDEETDPSTKASRPLAPESATEGSPHDEVSRRAYAVVHYHEIALKKRNRPHFVGRLVKNIEQAVSDLPVPRVVPMPGRLLVELDDESSWPELCERLASESQA